MSDDAQLGLDVAVDVLNMSDAPEGLRELAADALGARTPREAPEAIVEYLAGWGARILGGDRPSAQQRREGREWAERACDDLYTRRDAPG